MSRIWFCSDTHFGHQNIIKYCQRPYETAQEMDEALIATWNQCVQPDDDVYHLGDFAFTTPEKALQIAKRLNGKKHLIRGNHDRQKTLDAIQSQFVWIKDVHSLTVQDKSKEHGTQNMWLSHYAHRVWPHSNYGSWHLFGHSHGTLPDQFDSLSMDVGVDAVGFRPIEYSEIKAKMSWKADGRKAS